MGQEIKECLVEKIFKSLGFVLTHDGQNSPLQFKLPPVEIRFFTKKYRLWMGGKFVDTWVKFIYDRRKGECVDFEITSREPDGVKRWQRMAQEDRRVGH